MMILAEIHRQNWAKVLNFYSVEQIRISSGQPVCSNQNRVPDVEYLFYKTM